MSLNNCNPEKYNTEIWRTNAILRITESFMEKTVKGFFI
jgi:hypothetical protein